MYELTINDSVVETKTPTEAVELFHEGIIAEMVYEARLVCGLTGEVLADYQFENPSSAKLYRSDRFRHIQKFGFDTVIIV